MDLSLGGVQLRDLDDIAATRTAIFDRTKEAVQKLPPLQNARHTLELSGVDYIGPDRYSFADEHQALLSGRSLGRRLQGTWNLKDNATQKILDTRKVTLATVPYLTSLGTFINNGNDYGVANQLRLRPGIYAREKESGELESHVNVAKGFGHRYYLDPATGVFRINLHQSRMPLLPLLKTLGANDDQIRSVWGNELWAANVKKVDPTVNKKLYQKLYANRDATDDLTMGDAIRKAFAEIELDPEVMHQTLGMSADKLTPDVILAATNKLLRINRGEIETDDRDAMHFQKIMTPEDMFADSVPIARNYLRQLFWKVSNDGHLKRLQPQVFDKAVRGTLLDSGLGSPLEEVNPLEILDYRSRVSRMGRGGIPSSDSVPDASRNVQPSQFGFIDPIQTPESEKIGVDGRLAIQTRKGADGRLYSRFKDVRTGQQQWLSPQDIASKVLAFPLEMESGEPYVKALVNGKLQYAPRESVDYTLDHMTQAFGPMANLVPMKMSAAQQRGSMGSRMLTQALSLIDGEAPLVQAGIPGEPDKSFEQLYGKALGALHSDVTGTVMAVSPTEIKVRGSDGKVKTHELYSNRLFNRKSFLHNTPLVQVGQTVQPGTLLAKSNYTDHTGAMALGRNLRVAYLPTGKNHNDAVVISESAAKKLTSEHAYQHTLDKEDNVQAGKNKFIGIFPTKYPQAILKNFDDDGVIKPGTVVNYQEPLILAVKQATVGPRLGRRQSSYREADIVWEHHAPGVVTDVIKTKSGINVVVKGQQQMQLADKLSGLYGDKSTIAEIRPDHMMPTDNQGRPIEVLLDSNAVISRGNPAQVHAASLGKIAELTGKPYKVPDFDNIKDMRQYVVNELHKHGLSELEDLTDPETGQKIPQVLTGNRFIMKLHHMAESKAQSRSIGGYSASGEPAKGGSGGAKRVGLLNLNALLSHGAFNVARDASVVRGQRNEDYWRQFMSGYTPPQPAVPFVYEKFLNELTAMGIRPLKQGSRMNALAMTEKDITELASDRHITSGETVDWNIDRLTPVKGGLFDEGATGGHGGKKWSAIALHEPILNPVMEDPVKKILGLTQPQLEGIVAGRMSPLPLPKGGAGPVTGENTGPRALMQALANINLDREIARASFEIRGLRKTARNAAIQRQGFLRAAKKTGIHPKDWMLQRAPVLPPIFRPVSVMQGTGTPLVADANYLYRDLIEANDALKALDGKVDDVGDERLAVYNAFKAVTGMGDPIKQQTVDQKAKGILKSLTGSSPKFGTMQRKLLGSTVDLVGRAVIIPNPELDMDEIGVPEEEAWTLYKPFVVRRLVRRGMSHMQAVDEAAEQSDLAKKMLMDEMAMRPMLADRAPVLHRYGVMAFRPVLVRGKGLQIHPLVESGLGADYDGDAMQFHIPQDDVAAKEALEKMLPSRNLVSPANFKVHQMPSQGYIGGLFRATTGRNDRAPRIFRNVEDVIEAHRQGTLHVDDAVQIMNH